MSNHEAAAAAEGEAEEAAEDEAAAPSLRHGHSLYASRAFSLTETIRGACFAPGLEGSLHLQRTLASIDVVHGVLLEMVLASRFRLSRVRVASYGKFVFSASSTTYSKQPPSTRPVKKSTATFSSTVFENELSHRPASSSSEEARMTSSSSSPPRPPILLPRRTRRRGVLEPQ